MTATDPPAVQLDGLYHLATVPEWAAYQESGEIRPPSLDDEGFVHCSYGRQLATTVERHFAGVPDLLALLLDPAELDDVDMVDEDVYGSGEEYPHAYGPIPAAAVASAVPMS